MITIDSNTCRPVVRCDVCGEQIERAEEGGYAWDMREDEAQIRFAHKGDCFQELEQQLGPSVCDLDLSWLPVMLADALGVDVEGTRRLIARLQV